LKSHVLRLVSLVGSCVVVNLCVAQNALLDLDHTASQAAFAVAAGGKAAGIYVAPGNPETVRVAAEAFAGDVERVTGVRPQVLTSLKAPLPASLIVVGVVGKAPELDMLRAAKRLVTTAVDGKWEAAETVTILNPPASVLPGVKNALVIAGSDRRGAAYALFAISRAMGVSPWYWWADVPVAKHAAVYVRPGMHVQGEPSVQYRGIFFNDEDWGLRPWAAKKMDPTVDNGKGNIGPRTYEKVFELLLRLHANSLWPAMHPGSLAFNAVAENAQLADTWGIVMGSSHSEALLRNNVGEWSEAAPPKGDGPWNYQTNAAAMNAYWDKRLEENGKFENFYTVGLRGVHDSGLEAKGTPEVKARLVEDVMTEQRKLLAARVNPDVAKVPQVIWLYKESLDLYRVGMKVPDDVTLGWTDDNYGYIRELPNAAEQKRAGGSGVYYHVSYWGAPHDYLWLCTTPPALIQEEMTKAYDHNARKYWILNVGDLKPAEIDIDYFMQLAVDEPRMAAMSQREWLAEWFTEQFPVTDSGAPGSMASSSTLGSQVADVMTRYYALNFIRKPEFMGFNGYNDGVKRTEFNPLAWPSDDKRDQNRARAAAWSQLLFDEQKVAKSLPPQYASAFFELIDYPVEGSAAMNEKFLATDLTYLDAAQLDLEDRQINTERARSAYDEIQALTVRYNSLEGGKWDGMMSAAPRERHVFEMPRTATEADAKTPLPASWGADDSPAVAHPVKVTGFHEEHYTVSINAAHFTEKFDGTGARWNVLQDLGISGDSVVYGAPGLLANAPAAGAGGVAYESPSLDYEFTTVTEGLATLALDLLPTFAVDSEHRLRYAVAVDGGVPVEMDLTPSAAAKKSVGAGDGPSDSGWAENVLRNSAGARIPLGQLAAGKHTVRLLYRDPGVVFEHLVVTFAGAPPAYPVPPETR
jgi:Glycosyl hydrolase family 115/Gylcosyl hydrolase family 115 C-terminal domain